MRPHGNRTGHRAARFGEEHVGGDGELVAGQGDGGAVGGVDVAAVNWVQVIAVVPTVGGVVLAQINPAPALIVPQVTNV